MIFGLIGSLMVIVGVFLLWASVSASGISATSTGWELANAEYFYNITPEGRNLYPLVTLAGGIIGLIGSLGSFGTSIEKIEYLLPLGGIIAILSASWSFIDIIGLEGAAVGIGIYVCLIGGILALLSNLILREKISP